MKSILAEQRVDIQWYDYYKCKSYKHTEKCGCDMVACMVEYLLMFFCEHPWEWNPQPLDEKSNALATEVMGVVYCCMKK